MESSCKNSANTKYSLAMKTITPSVLFEDDAILVLDKPATWLTVPGRFPQGHGVIKDVKTWADQRYESIFSVHRLDRGTSGVIVFAKDAESHRDLSLQFQHRSVGKTYHAFVHGFPKKTKGYIDFRIAEKSSKGNIYKIDSNGQKAHTDYHCLARYGQISLIAFQPKTGRSHQIRVHAKSLGTPLLVDELYGPQDSFYLSSVKANYKGKRNERPFIQRLTLHAYSISICHPVTSNGITFTAPWPKDFRALHKQLKNHSPFQELEEGVDGYAKT